MTKISLVTKKFILLQKTTKVKMLVIVNQRTTLVFVTFLDLNFSTFVFFLVAFHKKKTFIFRSL